MTLNANDATCRYSCEYLKYHTRFETAHDGFLKNTFEHVQGEFLSSGEESSGQGNI